MNAMRYTVRAYATRDDFDAGRHAHERTFTGDEVSSRDLLGAPIYEAKIQAETHRRRLAYSGEYEYVTCFYDGA